MLKLLAKPKLRQGFTHIFYAGRSARFFCMVMEILGLTLEDCMHACQGDHIPIPSTLLVAEQVLSRIEYVHSKGITHRDIKPENFMFGVGDKMHHLYIIDFGLSEMYYPGQHVTWAQDIPFAGTARYASINALSGVQQSRRDDLEAIAYMLIYLVKGSLPWSGLKADSHTGKRTKIKERKQATPIEDLCCKLPDAFKSFLREARSLKFDERPGYDVMKQLFKTAREEHGPHEDHAFQWLEEADLDPARLVPLLPYDNIRQPDDPDGQVQSRASRGWRRWCCCFSKPVAQS